MKVDELMGLVREISGWSFAAGVCDGGGRSGYDDEISGRDEAMERLRTALSACVAEWLPVDTEAVIDESKDYFVCWNLQCHFPEYATAWRRGDSWICPSDQRVYLVTPTHYRVATPPTPPPTTETEGETK